MINAIFTPLTFDQATRMTYDDRAVEITLLCEKIEALEDQGRPDLAAPIHDTLQNLTCAQGTCGHYTCTEGQALAEWEAFERLAGRDI